MLEKFFERVEPHAVEDVRTSTPVGASDDGGRWYPAHDPLGCVAHLRAPSREYPNSYLSHWRTKKHAKEIVLHAWQGGQEELAKHEPRVVRIMQPLLVFQDFLVKLRPEDSSVLWNVPEGGLYTWIVNGMAPVALLDRPEGQALVAEWALRQTLERLQEAGQGGKAV